MKFSMMFMVRWYLKSYLWWQPRRAISELWQYGYIRSWDERVGMGGMKYKRWAKLRNDFSRYRHNRRIGKRILKKQISMIDCRYSQSSGCQITPKQLNDLMSGKTVNIRYKTPEKDGIFDLHIVELSVHNPKFRCSCALCKQYGPGS